MVCLSGVALLLCCGVSDTRGGSALLGALPALGASLLLPSVLAEPHMLPDGSPSDITLEEAKGYGWTSLEERRRTMIPFEP